MNTKTPSLVATLLVLAVESAHAGATTDTTIFAIQLSPTAAYAIGGETGLAAGPSVFGIAAIPGGSSGGIGGGGGGGGARAAEPRAASVQTMTPSRKNAISGEISVKDGAKPTDSPAFSKLGALVLSKAHAIGRRINETGGYRFDGYNDCYGFVRRVWDPILSSWEKAPLPVNDYVSAAWRPVASWDALQPGDVVATHQGHRWGPHWHVGLYAGRVKGKHMIYDNSGRSSRGGAYLRELPPGLFHYYYSRTHALLAESDD
ncbi:MAG: C40 family peptidase [Elusimicrobia bacterium]|nr:C40 family peptidase [Elusimicrobiota bacterium]